MVYIKGAVCGDYMYVTTYQKTPYNYGKSKKRIEKATICTIRSALSNIHSVGRNLSTLRRIDNVRRTQRQLHKIILANSPTPQTTIFVTLTYKDNFTDHKESRNHFRLFAKKLKLGPRSFIEGFVSILVKEFR